jgi:hypothetical protein
MQREGKNEDRIWPFCLPIGIALGVGMSFGVALGTIFSLLLYYRNPRE